MTKPRFNFGNIVVVEGNLIGVVVKSWGPKMRGGVQTDEYEHEVYVRSFNSIGTYLEPVRDSNSKTGQGLEKAVH